MDWNRSGRCRICGCTADRACWGGCCWIEDDLCSTCAPYLNIPQELRELPRWVAYGKAEKRPINPHTGTVAHCLEPSTWGTFEDAVSFANTKETFIIAMVLPDNIFAIDVDSCVVNDSVNQLAYDIVHEMKGYTEISPSGKGVHILCCGQLPPNTKYPKQIGPSSFYGAGRLVAFTGQQIFEEYSFVGDNGDMESKRWWLRGTAPRWRNDSPRRERKLYKF